MGLDLRLVFLLFLLLTAVIFALRRGPVLGLNDLWVMFLDFLLIPLIAGTVLTFALIITRTDPMGIILEISRRIGGRFNVSFIDAIPPRLANTLEVQSVTRRDTDGDGFNEWVVFYRFDLQTGRSPILGAVYDNDRGNPPIVFPYQLRPPDRDYLSESEISLEFTQIPAAATESPEEILVKGSNELSIFRFKPENKSQEWEPPKDVPAVYDSIGFFRGSGGVSFIDESKEVAVISREGFERSQLVWRAIYQYNPQTESYWDNSGATVLAPPRLATVDFFQEPPNDIFNTAFPEKIVLAFYTATCGSTDDSLCRNAEVDWNPRDFLAPVENCQNEPPSELGRSAFCEFENGNAQFFGLRNFNNESNVLITRLRYYPPVEETNIDVTYAGVVPQSNCVEVVLGNPLPGETDSYAYRMKLVAGAWKIDRRVDVTACTAANRQISDSGATFAPPAQPTPLPPLGPPPVVVPTQVPSP